MAVGGDKVDIGIAADHSVYVDEQNPNGTWSGTIDLGGYLQSISAVQTENGLPVVFGIGSDDAAYVDEQMPSGAWTGWVWLGGNVVDYQSIVATTGPTGAPEVFVIGNDTAVWVDEQSFTANQADFGTIDSSWTGFTRLGGDFSSVMAADNGFGTLEIVAMDSSGNQWFNAQGTNDLWDGLVQIAEPSTASSSTTSVTARVVSPCVLTVDQDMITAGDW